MGLLTACNGPSAPTATPVPGAIGIELRNFSFTPKDLKVTAGDPVNLSLKSMDIDHTFTVKELGIDWQVNAGAIAPQTYAFAKPGTFRVICAIAGHEGAGMVGTVTVQ